MNRVQLLPWERMDIYLFSRDYGLAFLYDDEEPFQLWYRHPSCKPTTLQHLCRPLVALDHPLPLMASRQKDTLLSVEKDETNKKQSPKKKQVKFEKYWSAFPSNENDIYTLTEKGAQVANNDIKRQEYKTPKILYLLLRNKQGQTAMQIRQKIWELFMPSNLAAPAKRILRRLKDEADEILYFAYVRRWVLRNGELSPNWLFKVRNHRYR